MKIHVPSAIEGAQLLDVRSTDKGRFTRGLIDRCRLGTGLIWSVIPDAPPDGSTEAQRVFEGFHTLLPESVQRRIHRSEERTS